MEILVDLPSSHRQVNPAYMSAVSWGDQATFPPNETLDSNPVLPPKMSTTGLLIGKKRLRKDLDLAADTNSDIDCDDVMHSD
jgi:hypothetical protein